MPFSYKSLAQSENYKNIDWRLKIITWSVATISAISTAYSNGFSHRATIGTIGAIALAALTLLIVEFSLYTLEEGLRSTFKGGTQRSLAWLGKWTIKATMIGNAAYLCSIIAGVSPSPILLAWNRWSFAVHFAVGLLLIPMIRDADPVIANQMLRLRAETAQEDQIIARMAAAVGSPGALFGARVRGILDGMTLGWRLARNRQGFSPTNYVANLNALARQEFNFAEGRQITSSPELSDWPTALPPDPVHPQPRRNS